MNLYGKWVYSYGIIAYAKDISDYKSVILDYSRKQQIKRLNKKLLDTVDPLEQARLAEEIRKLRIGEKQNGKWN